jgi:hypothetical protein
MDGITVTQDDMLQAVRESALLATVTIGVFNAEKSDRSLVEKVKQDAQATGDVGRFIKNTLAGADSKLKKTQGAFAHVRALHYSLTLPWISDPHAERHTGPRLLPHLLLDKYLNTLSAQKRVAMGLLDEFIAEYPNLVTQARLNLGLMADADYPSADEIKRQFRVNFDFEPIPAGAAFKGLSDHVMERLSKSLQMRQARMVETAIQSMLDDARARLTNMIERLTTNGDRVKNATIENVRVMIGLLPGWNLTGDPKVTRLVEDLQKMLDGVNAEYLRKDSLARDRVSDQARDIIGRIA